MVIKIILFIIAIPFLLFIVSLFTPVPLALIVRWLFASTKFTALPQYPEMEEQVTIQKDLKYPSKFKDNTLNIYLPKNTSAPLPVILWVHGGAFVGGDKQDAHYYSASLSFEGYAVISMNYMRAPEATFPTPLVQMQEVYAWMLSVKDEYSLDMSKIILAGDSAGAFSCVIFALVQINPVFAKEVKLSPCLPPECLKGLLLYCGPYFLDKIPTLKQPIKYAILQMGWAFFGTKSWVKKYSSTLSIQKYLNSSFPPAFIADANTASFEAHGRELAEDLNELGVFTQTQFIPLETERTFHAYQFKMDTPSAAESYYLTVKFLKEILNTDI